MARKLIVVLLSTVMCLLAVTSALAVTYDEAPMLRTKVAAGELPSVEERLPKHPLVLSAERNEVPKENLDFEIGEYGGILRTVQINPGFNPDIFSMLREPLVSAPGILAKDIKGNIVKDFEVSEDEKVFTFHMREGLKWSDGYPVTTEDVLFAYEDVLMNEKIVPVISSWLRAGNKPTGEPFNLKIIDDYTFRISFAEPYGAFPVWLAMIGWASYQDLLKPKHYLKNFHPRYTPLEKLEPLIKEERLAKGEWWTLFDRKDIGHWELSSPQSVGFPVLSPWIAVKTTPERTTFDRNPYYFKVDAEGNQLPYIDKLRGELVSNIEMATMKIVSGEADFVQEPSSLGNLALYKENEEKGGYRTVILDAPWTPVHVYLKLTDPSDPIWNEILRDVRFRKALSLSINRKEIIDNVYHGFGESTKLIPSEYNPKKANELLDEMGLKRDPNGWRLRPDGKKIVIPIEFAAYDPNFVPVTELVVEHWKEFGIQTTMKQVGGPLLSERAQANKVKATVMWNHSMWWGWGAFDFGGFATNIWPLWDKWVTSEGKEGEEPPADVKRFIELLRESVVVSPEKAGKKIDEYRQLFYDNIYWIQLTAGYVHPMIVSKKLRNVQHKGFDMTLNFSVEQLFFKQ